nr:MAG TPA: hypothetical protein [Bacteriophage sp.]
MPRAPGSKICVLKKYRLLWESEKVYVASDEIVLLRCCGVIYA